MTDDPAELYRALLVSDRLPHLRRLTYRCATPARCLLLDVVETPLGILLHQRRFKQSDAINRARSNESGRASNTTDGDRHWKPRTYWLAQSALRFRTDPDVIGGEAGLQDVHCDHVGGEAAVLLTADEFATDWEAAHAVVLVRPDGSRMV